MPTFKHPCPYCDKFIDRAVAACPYCGVVEPFSPKRCQNCRKIVEDPAWTVCPSCGASLIAQPPAAAAGQGGGWATAPGRSSAVPGWPGTPGQPVPGWPGAPASAPAQAPVPAQAPAAPSQAPMVAAPAASAPAQPAVAMPPAGKCSGCGAPLSAGARFCTVCGTMAG